MKIVTFATGFVLWLSDAGGTGVSVRRYEGERIQNAWHGLGYNPAGGEETLDRLSIPIGGKSYVMFQRNTLTGRRIKSLPGGGYEIGEEDRP